MPTGLRMQHKEKHMVVAVTERAERIAGRAVEDASSRVLEAEEHLESARHRMRTAEEFLVEANAHLAAAKHLKEISRG